MEVVLDRLSMVPVVVLGSVVVTSLGSVDVYIVT